MPALARRAVDLPDVRLVAEEWGPADGPLALLLHGFPDTPWTWRHLGPMLAEHGWHAVAPALRGYAPSALPSDGDMSVAALARDALGMHKALGADDRAVLVGHDWGAIAGYAAVSGEDPPFRRLVAMAVPPLGALPRSWRSGNMLRVLPGQLRRSWYVGAAQLPLVAEQAMPRLVDRLWRDWSPGLEHAEDVARVRAALAGPGRWSAALGCYRQLARDIAGGDDAWRALPRVPTLYLHGERDGCLSPELGADVARLLPPGSARAVVADAGHFLHLDRPEDVGRQVLAFLSSGTAD